MKVNSESKCCFCLYCTLPCPSVSGKDCVCVRYVHVCVCEAVGEVRGCEGEGYPTASERKRKREGGSSLACGKKKRRDEKWTINEWLCSPDGLGSLADEELTLTGKSQLGTGLCLSFVCIRSLSTCSNTRFYSFISLSLCLFCYCYVFVSDSFSVFFLLFIYQLTSCNISLHLCLNISLVSTVLFPLNMLHIEILSWRMLWDYFEQS